MSRTLMWIILISLMIFPFSSFSQRRIAKTRRTKSTKTNVSVSSQRLKILAYALQHNPGLRAFQARVKRARAALKGSRAFPNNPTLSAGGGAQFPANSTPASGQTSSILPRASADLSLAFPIGGRFPAHLASTPDTSASIWLLIERSSNFESGRYH